jgi:salicylate hydroxylase
VRYGARVEAVDEEKAHVTLACGEVVEADVVVGVDGMKGLLRKVVLEEDEEDEEDEEESEQAGYVLFK